MSRWWQEIADVGSGLLHCVRFFAVLHLSNKYGYSTTTCIGPSMLPTFRERGDIVIVDNFSTRVLGKPYKRGDIVVCQAPDSLDKTVCKRLAGLPGDVISYRYANGIHGRYQVLKEVPPGHVWLLGDNSSNSSDSRYYGPVPMGLLEGKVICRIAKFPDFFEKVR